MGLMANYAIVFARAVVGENDYGVSPFMVQLRSQEDHSLMSGVTCGDLGTKLGYNAIDNGYLSFDQYRIPRVDMLSRFSSIDIEGNFVLNGDPRVLYSIMVTTRMNISRGCGLKIMNCLLIAARYAVCRRQFKTMPGNKEERKLIDY